MDVEADLALAAGCAANDRDAIATFEGVLRSEVEAAGRATRATRDAVDEVAQILRVQMLVAKDGKPPGIAGYRGKGPLRGWLRITATRELIRHAKKRERERPMGSIDQSIERLLGARGAGGDPLLSQLKAEYRQEFSIALREAIVLLDAEDRMVLRQQLVDGLSIDEIGAAFGVHRATAARWITRARERLVARTHEALAARLRIPVEEIAGVIDLVMSRLDASVVRYLRDPEA